MNKFMKITLAMVLALAMCFSMVACGTTEADLDELDAVLDEAIEELDEELAEEEVTDEEVVEEEVVEEEAAEEVVEEEAVEDDMEYVIVNWEVVAAVDAEGNEVSAEDMGTSIVYAFNETLLEVAAYIDGEVAAVGTYAENEDHVEITLDGEVAYGYMDGDYFVVETADGTAQYCSLLG